ncbi:DNA helicase [Gordonia phage Gibbles]|uniref:DNA helicase n=3 Tax=Gordonia phage Orchid TaxID=1838075 RepID=A0A160DHD3_9CAUD|nr:DNA helicase [Gordonia phage Orchid]ANA87292.1 DNA helicase [Gordonia phage PatrickStar]ANA87519.1 DNA helicase [Gordonia phage Kampe]AXH46509.1 DNA helicase [Gordonia phage RobinSparkles]QDK02015.1 DNA helicase [Gordonia phage Gibbles]ANA87404.1 DNA helicase [Gordonia phage Orchid]
MTLALPPRKSLEPYIPDELTYYPHQIEGIRRMIKMRSVLLADDMGLGKSLQAITLFAADVIRGYSSKCLIVCPASLKTNWENEILKFTRGIKVMVIRTDTTGKALTKEAKRKNLQDFAAADGPRVLITNYEQLVGMSKDYCDISWDMVIFDEAHMIKNHRAKRTQAALKLSTRRSILLTGSPILNHVNDLWSLLKRIAPNEIENYYAFLQRYATYGGYMDKQITGIKNEAELRARLQDVMVRRLKEDVLDLPEVTYTTRTVDLINSQIKIYKEVVSNMQLTSDDGQVEEIQNHLTKFLRLKQVCGTTAAFSNKDDSGKLDMAEWDAEDICSGGERLVAFTQFRDVQQAYIDRLTNRRSFKYPIYVLNGDVDIDERQSVVDAWANDKTPGIIICMYQVAGVGLNMTAGRYGQRIDKLWNPSLNKQAVDRLHRIGADKTKPVTIIDYLARDTVEERVEKILDNKTKISNKLIELDSELDSLTQAAIKQALREEKNKYV